uniref:Uncharacterized protein n=1 Tax=Anguilla anguilla TaxID=7936 RepID=A0A0E9VWF2_ANGAN
MFYEAELPKCLNNSLLLCKSTLGPRETILLEIIIDQTVMV